MRNEGTKYGVQGFGIRKYELRSTKYESLEYEGMEVQSRTGISGLPNPEPLHRPLNAHVQRIPLIRPICADYWGRLDDHRAQRLAAGVDGFVDQAAGIIARAADIAVAGVHKVDNRPGIAGRAAQGDLLHLLGRIEIVGQRPGHVVLACAGHQGHAISVQLQ